MRAFAGGTAVITGAASGIGMVLARRAARERMNLVLADIELPRLQGAIAELPCHPERVLAQACDVSVEADVAALAAQERESHVVNTASVAGLLSTPASAAYNVSKHGVVTLSETLYQELKAENSRVGVSLLCPAWVKTGIDQAGRNRQARYGEASPAGEMSRALEDRIAKALESGRLSADDMADAVFAAVAEERFYVIPHRKILEVVKRRCEDIVEGRNPSPAG